MSYPIENKFVIALASSALFDLGEGDNVYKKQGPEAYKQYQKLHINDTLSPGVAFPFVKRLLGLNTIFSEEPVEVILLSRNSPETGLRVFNSIKAHSLNITRAGFFSGQSPYQYLNAFNATIFLSGNAEDVKHAVDEGYPAGLVIQSEYIDDNDPELRLAFDFDAVLADDESEKVYKASGSVEEFHKHEVACRMQSLQPGPLKNFLAKVASFQQMEREKEIEGGYTRLLRTSIVTARNAPSHERMINTLKEWGISVDSAFFLGGIEKRRILEVLKPHLFFDDQITHLNSINIPQVHIPFGIANNKIP
jgi:5'-nucleotidase